MPQASPHVHEETRVESSLCYAPGDPVVVRVIRREQRVDVTDDGAAVQRAGVRPGWNEVASRLERELVVNISRQGVVSLPVVPVGPDVETITQRIAEASLALYQELLDLER